MEPVLMYKVWDLNAHWQGIYKYKPVSGKLA